jgi:CheY-like chemotaxis protein
MKVTPTLAMPKVQGMEIPATVAAAPPAMKVIKAPGMITDMAMPKMPGMEIPATVNATQPEAKPMEIPGIVTLNATKIQALNFLGNLSFLPPKEMSKKEASKASGIDMLTKNITNNIQKTETINSQASTTNNDSVAKIQVTYSPQINISSAMDAKAKNDLMSLLESNKDALMKLINEETRKEGRLKYA